MQGKILGIYMLGLGNFIYFKDIYTYAKDIYKYTEYLEIRQRRNWGWSLSCINYYFIP